MKRCLVRGCNCCVLRIRREKEPPKARHQKHQCQEIERAEALGRQFEPPEPARVECKTASIQQRDSGMGM